jgi:hypothetical protein
VANLQGFKTIKHNVQAWPGDQSTTLHVRSVVDSARGSEEARPFMTIPRAEYCGALLLTLAFLMEQNYIVIQETKRKCKSTGSSKTMSSNPVGGRFWHSRSSPADRIIAILCETRGCLKM